MVKLFARAAKPSRSGELLDSFIARADRTLLQRMADAIAEMVQKLKSTLSRRQLTDMERARERLLYAYESGARAAQELQIGESGGVERYSMAGIAPNMMDDERVAILQNKKVTAAPYTENRNMTGADIIKLKGMYTSRAKDVYRTIAEKCGIFRDDYTNDDVGIEFGYSRNGLDESRNKQIHRGGDAEDFGKMLTLLPEIIDGAIEVETHEDKYAETKRADENLKEMHVLLGAFKDGDALVPVQLEIKEFYPKAKTKNRLYVTVTMKKSRDHSTSRNFFKEETLSHGTPAFEYTIADLLGVVNDERGGLLRYIPDGMLSKEQTETKRRAMQEEAEMLGDMRYEYAVEQGQEEDALRMLGERAEEKGYGKDNSWRMDHRAPDSRYGVNLEDMNGAFGNDDSIYSNRAAYYYGDGRSYDGKAIRAIQQARNSPDKLVTIYRAVPMSVQDTRPRNGDWVTLTREYAKEHAERVFDGDYRIIESKVPVKYLWGNGDSIHEFGYDNGNGAEVYKNTPNNVKLAAITRDDRGQLIPLSQRYDENSKDERYSIKGVHEAQLEVERLTQEAKASGWTPQQLAERVTAAEGIIPLAHMPTQGLFLCCPHDPERRFESGRELFACYLARSSQKATALAAATLSESTPCSIGIRTV